MLKIGAHLSVGKGFENLIQTAINIDSNVFQFFSRNPRGSKIKEFDENDIALFQKLRLENKFGPLLAHAPYTINLAGSKDYVYDFAKQTLKEDITSMDSIGIEYFNIHPGSHVGSGIEVGIKKIIDALNYAMYSSEKIIVLLETMSGKGSEIGFKFEQLKNIMDGAEQEEKIGILNSKIDYKITLLENKNYTDLKSHEKKLIQWLIEDIGDGKSVYLSKIKQDSKKYSVQFNTKYEEWIREANTTSQLLNNFFEPVNNNLSKSIIRLLVIALPFFLLISSSDLFFVIIFMFVIIISIIIMGIISLYKRRTQEAQLEYEKWLAFKKFLKDFSNLNDAQIGSIVLWEHYLVYAVSLGVAKQVIKQLPLVFTKNDLESNNLVLIPFFCSSHDNFDHFENLNSQFQQSISSAKNIAQSKNSSTTGSGGGFSSGSSGGSGSRGGGGAF